ncbi:uncharacterized protein LOC133530432 [Cydia pomonella]|uniref:uncharacterized protein LOC133530432 n=1 Tax=Cydia pomonella TaxID=82600 RepID=UPI002ADD71C5|nr:uncharacterized protein LOC133530432 [Cydia pomonella]
MVGNTSFTHRLQYISASLWDIRHCRLKKKSVSSNDPISGWCVHGPINQDSSKKRTASDILFVSHSPSRAHHYRSLPLGKSGASPIVDEAGRLTYDNRGLPGARAAPVSTCASSVLSPAEQTCCDESSVLFIDASEPTDNYNADVLLHETVRNYFNLESVGVTSKKRENKEEQQAISILNDTAKLKNGRWEVGLPWKNKEKFVESYSTAERRLKSVEKRLRSNEEYASRYRERIRHLFENDYARELKPEESGNRIWVIPHFGVDNPRKKKLRLVFDCASISHGKCLNDYLLQGPDLLNSLYGIMLRFRENPIGITGDIRDMFLRIKIREEDQHALRFLWRDSQDQPIKQYIMTSLLFGGNCSPFIAQFIRDKNAQQFSETKPNAVRAIMHSHYVDDFIDSLPTESEAINIIDDVSTVHKFGGFEIRGWTSNNKNVLSHLPKDQLSTNGGSLLVDGENKTQRTLGLLWDPAHDTLAVDVSFKNIPEDILKFKKTPTKREILRITMSIYDIFGILAPVTIKGKILLKSIWKTALSWDDKISEELFIEFKHWITDLKGVVHLNIPRWYFTTSANFITSAKETTSILELHLFCDAAPTAFAAVAYWRLVNANGDVCVSFIACKNKISSMKRLSIPRSELESALIAARLAKTIKDEHRIKCDRMYFWTDSSCVLHWIRNHNRNYKEYIANRLGEIDELTSSLEWRYVPSHLNIADIATKKTQYMLRADCEWFRGPAFLYQKEDQWPKDILTPEINKLDDLEIALMVQPEAITIDIPEPERFSSWIRLVRATAAVLKFINKIKILETCEATIIGRAECLILRYSQLQSFGAEMALLAKEKTLNKNSLPVILTLAPYLDQDGLMRVGGRIDAAADISPEMKRPIILDGRNYVTRLIVQFYHENAAHGYQEMVVNELKQKYWIIRIRPTVKYVAARCMTCRIQKAQPEVPRMGELPEARMAHHQRPFSNTGLDLFGPMEITVGRRREKRYAVLFTCLTIRAVHIELVHSLSTDSLILALRRMAARRGWPKQLFSDNGTNLRGANTEIKLAAEELDKSLLTTYAANRGVTWNFIPPASPHMAGAWERIIRSIKTTLKVTLKERAPREEVLLTLLAEAENMSNSRPLTHVSVEPDYPEGLTPHHFLLGTSSNLPLMGSFDDTDFFLRRQWRISQRLADMYWSRWVKEVLPTMLPRQKWHEECRVLQVGDLVLIADPSAPRNHWARGLVQEVCPGKDGRVRTVHVKTKSRVLVRPAARIVRLPV